jgi:hypothetical protein
MTQDQTSSPSAIDETLRDAFRRIEQQPVPKSLDALVDALVGEDEGAEP